MVSDHTRQVLDDAASGTGVVHPTGELHGTTIPEEFAANWDSSAALGWAVNVLDPHQED